jgi:hypothetical protein
MLLLPRGSPAPPQPWTDTKHRPNLLPPGARHPGSACLVVGCSSAWTLGSPRCGGRGGPTTRTRSPLPFHLRVGILHLRACYNRRPTSLHGATDVATKRSRCCYFELEAVLLWRDGVAPSGCRSCYNGAAEVLPAAAGPAIMARRRCSQRPSVLLQWPGGVAHSGRRCCYNGPAAASATIGNGRCYKGRARLLLRSGTAATKRGDLCYKRQGRCATSGGGHCYQRR